VDRDNVGVAQYPCRRSFPAKALNRRTARELARQNQFHRYDSAEAALARLIDDPHATPANFLEQLIVAKLTARGARRGSSRVRARPGIRSRGVQFGR
jgi:hypothetical protein